MAGSFTTSHASAVTAACVSDQLPRPRQILVGDLDDADAAPGAALYFFLVARKHVPGAAAYRAYAQQSYADRIHRANFPQILLTANHPF